MDIRRLWDFWKCLGNIYFAKDSFSGPVSVRHLRCFDSLPIQNENPVTPSILTLSSHFLTYFSWSMLFTFIIALSILSSRNSRMRKSINVSATRKNVQVVYNYSSEWDKRKEGGDEMHYTFWIWMWQWSCFLL